MHATHPRIPQSLRLLDCIIAHHLVCPWVGIQQGKDSFPFDRVQFDLFCCLGELVWAESVLVEDDLLSARVVQISHHHLLIPVDVLIVLDRSVVERKLAIHDYLIQVKGCSFDIDENRLFELGSLSDNHATFPNDEHIRCHLASVLDDLTSIVFTVSKIHHEVVDESLLATSENYVQFGDHILEKNVDKCRFVLFR